MAPITEVAFLPIHSTLDLESDSSPGHTTHTNLMRTVLRQPGCQRLYWSREHETATHLRWFVDWDSLADHHNFMNSPDYKPFFTSFGEILNGAPLLWHAEYIPHGPSKVLDSSLSPATEVITLYFPIDISAQDQTVVVDRLTKLAAVAEKATTGFRGMAGGWVMEDLQIPGTEDKGKAYSVLFGWDSVEAHMAFRETQAFKDNSFLIREAKDLKGINVVHVHGKAHTL